MKRTKMIFSAFAVAAIVTGSLAFTNKPYAQSYCVKTGAAGTCTNFLSNQRTNASGNLYRGYASTDPSCPQTCSVQIRLLDEE